MSEAGRRTALDVPAGFSQACGRPCRRHGKRVKTSTAFKRETNQRTLQNEAHQIKGGAMNDIRVERHDYGRCTVCGQSLESSENVIWGDPDFIARPKFSLLRLWRICECCQHYDTASVEADKEGWRFTAIGTGINEEGMNPMRCMCGAVTHTALRLCVQCSKETRMLSKKEKEAKLLHKVLVELRREIKTQKKRLEETLTT